MENQPRGSKKRERRREKRFQIQSPKPEEDYTIVHLSARGAMVRGRRPVKVGQRTSLQVTLPKGLTRLHFQGKIKWVKQAEEGEKIFYSAGKDPGGLRFAR